MLREKGYPVESLANILSRAVPLKFMFRRSDRAILSRAGLIPSFMKIITDFLHVAESVLRNSFSVMKKFPRFYLLYMKFQYLVHNSRPQEPVQFSHVQILIHYVSNIYLNTSIKSAGI